MKKLKFNRKEKIWQLLAIVVFNALLLISVPGFSQDQPPTSSNDVESVSTVFISNAVEVEAENDSNNPAISVLKNGNPGFEN